MHSFRDMYCHSSPYFLRGDDITTKTRNNNNNNSNNNNIGEFENSVVFHQQEAVDLSTSSLYGLKSGNVTFSSSLPFATVNPGNYVGGEVVVDAGELLVEKRAAAVRNRRLDRWGRGEETTAAAAMADAGQHTDTSTDVDTDDRNRYRIIQNGAIVVDSADQSNSADQSKGKNDDQKTLRRLAQNREAARKSRMRKKAYVQQLENSRLRLAHMERELEKARQQGFIVSGSATDAAHSLGSNGIVAFDTQYGRWLDEHQRLINDTRSALDSHMADDELRSLVDGVMCHYDDLYRLKNMGAKTDIFHMLSGMWKTPAERCFMWLGGYRSSEILKIVVSHLEPLTEQQLMGICNLQQSSQQAEDALSQGMEALQQSLVETLSATCLGPGSTGMVADYMGQMAIAMGKLGTLENFVHQADLLRQQTLQQMHRILTTRQAARALLVIHDYTTRLRALSSLWLARPRNFS